MRCGVSTACFYPKETLESLKMVVETGAKVTELFLNTMSELEDGYIAKLADVAKAAGVSVVAVHPFFSPIEGFLFASNYARRHEDGLKFYERYFQAAQALGADKLVFHGDGTYNVDKFPLEAYAERYIQLAQLGRQYGVSLCHENVAWCRLNSARRVCAFRPLLGEYAAFVLDIKQVVRKKGSIPAMLKAMAKSLRHVHISDHRQGENCLPPGTGSMDYPAFLHSLGAVGYEGDLIIELYSHNFDSVSELTKSMRYVQALIDK